MSLTHATVDKMKFKPKISLIDLKVTSIFYVLENDCIAAMVFLFKKQDMRSAQFYATFCI